ncbi:uncharacterized protein LOC142348575 isoform X3 [Convolutriloba macropyga]|uniref:uncharacterized protein LOC142348575 isoform X3 n=1 Tax=Convolutriloba macropyga TaxID=536237 RepID=UPI003F523BE7
MHSETSSTICADFARCQESKKLLMHQLHNFLEEKMDIIQSTKSQILSDHNTGSDIFLNSFIGYQERVAQFEKFCKVLPLVLDRYYNANDINNKQSPTLVTDGTPKEKPSIEQLTTSSHSSGANGSSHRTSSGMTIDDLLPPVEVKNNFIGYMVHCESSQAIFCTPKKLLAQYNELEESVNHLQSKVPLEVDSIALPAMALAPSKKYPGCLYRALILDYKASDSGSMCKVMFVDWGNEEIVDAAKVLKIPAKFCMLPPAVKISLAYGEDGCPFKHALPHSKRVTNLLKKVLTGKDGHSLPIRVQVYERPKRAGDAFQVYASLQNEKDCIRSIIVNQLSESTDTDSSPKATGSSNVQNSNGSQGSNQAHKTKPEQSYQHQATSSRFAQGAQHRPHQSRQIERFYTEIVEPANVNSLDDMSVIAKEDKMHVFMKSNFGLSSQNECPIPPEDEVSIAPNSPDGSHFTSISHMPPNAPYRYDHKFNF